MNITIVGTGYVGLVTGACFSEWGHDVLCVDNDESKVKQLKALKMPIYEDGLEDLVRATWPRDAFTSPPPSRRARIAEVIFIAVGTPPGYRGEANLSYVEQVGRQVAENMTDYRCWSKRAPCR
jgi:UDPglucose 6-dehydrogenase